MKKLLAFAVIAIAATTIQAATISWGAETLNSANTTGLTGNGSETSVDYEGYATAGTVYNLIFFGDTAPATTPTKYDTDTGLTDVAGGTKVDSYTLSQDDADDGGFFKVYIPASGANGYYMVTMYDATTHSADFFNFQITGATDTGSAFDAKSIMDGEIGTRMGSVEVVPEPTSVALLALGLAALGLKRKVA